MLIGTWQVEGAFFFLNLVEGAIFVAGILVLGFFWWIPVWLIGCICCHSILEGQNLAKVIDLIVPCFSTSWQLIVCSYTDHPDASGPATHHHAQPNQMSDYFSEKVSDSRTKSDSNAHVKRLQLCLPWPHQTKKIH